jgi:hypothetical protein
MGDLFDLAGRIPEGARGIRRESANWFLNLISDLSINGLPVFPGMKTVGTV